MPPGRFTVSASPRAEDVPIEPLLWPRLLVDVNAPSNHVMLVARQPSTCLKGTLLNAAAFGAQTRIRANTSINAAQYVSDACSDVMGEFCIPVFPGQWTVQADDAWLMDYGLRSIAPRDVIVPADGPPPPVSFVVTPIDGDFRRARFLKPVVLHNGARQLELRGQISLSWRIERSSDLMEWTPIALQTARNGILIMEESLPPAMTFPQAAFYRAVWAR
jgi:hypothetical protein